MERPQQQDPQLREERGYALIMVTSVVMLVAIVSIIVGMLLWRQDCMPQSCLVGTYQNTEMGKEDV